MKNEMRKIVETGYDHGDYVAAFRREQTPNAVEKHFLDRLFQLSAQSPRILDLGSGTGIPIDKYLVEKGAEVTGIDISQKHVIQARKNVPQARFILGDFSRIDLAEASFDAVVSIYAIFHIPREEQGALFRKAHGLLKAPGVFLATLGTSDSDYAEQEDWAGAPMAWSTYEPDAYAGLITESGFSIVETRLEGKPGDDEYHFWMLAQKT